MSSHLKIIRETLLAPIIDNLKQITAQIEAVGSEEGDCPLGKLS